MMVALTSFRWPKDDWTFDLPKFAALEFTCCAWLFAVAALLNSAANDCQRLDK